MFLEGKIISEEALKAIRTFLSFFGYTLVIDRADGIKVYKNEEFISRGKVGNNRISFGFETPLGALSANAYVKTDAEIDTDKNDPYHRVIVIYTIREKELSNYFSGTSIIYTNTASSSRNICYHDLVHYKDGLLDYKLAFKPNGKLFESDITCPEYRERIEISPYCLGGGIIHRINDIDIEAERSERLYASVSSKSEKYPKSFRLYKETMDANGKRNVIEQSSELDGSYRFGSKEYAIHAGELMQKLDPEMSVTIRQLRDRLTIDDWNFFDELLSSSLGKLSDEEIRALFGISLSIQKVVYKKFVVMPNRKLECQE